jgi:hypothetical protein
VLLRRVELRNLGRNCGEQTEAERREADDAEDGEECEEPELADAPPLRARRCSPEKPQNRGSVVRL